MKTTIKDIARLCDVSITTVSRVLNNKTESIGAQTVKKVQQKIDELGFRPNLIARSMITRQSHTVGLVIPDIRNPFFSEFARGVEDHMNNQGYGVFLCNTDSSLEKENQYLDLLQGKLTDGIIFTTQNKLETSKYFGDFIKNQFPIVLMERYLEGNADIPGIYVDNKGGAADLCRFIISRGHQNIACITGPLQTTNARLRLEGYKEALLEAGIKINEQIIIEGNYRYGSGRDGMKNLLDNNKSKFTAVFACNDMMAFGAYETLEEYGLKVPDDISLAGFDNIPFPKVFKPQITTVNLPAYNMGEKSAEMLMKIIRKEKLNDISFQYSLDIIDKGSVDFKK